jgi:hypothetical protein
LKYEDRPDYGTLKALFWDLLTNNGLNIATEYMFDWYKEENEEVKKLNETEGGQSNNVNLIDLTPQGKNAETKNSKKDQFTFTKTGDFNSPQKKASKHGSEISKKNLDRDFSESGSDSIASSDEDDSEKKKHHHQSKKCNKL